jgi:hypothetical protein
MYVIFILFLVLFTSSLLKLDKNYFYLSYLILILIVKNNNTIIDFIKLKILLI